MKTPRSPVTKAPYYRSEQAFVTGHIWIGMTSTVCVGLHALISADQARGYPISRGRRRGRWGQERARTPPDKNKPLMEDFKPPTPRTAARIHDLFIYPYRERVFYRLRKDKWRAKKKTLNCPFKRRPITLCPLPLATMRLVLNHPLHTIIVFPFPRSWFSFLLASYESAVCIKHRDYITSSLSNPTTSPLNML